MKEYELIPRNGRASFYRKAKVRINKDGSETLFSYDTPIIKRKDNKLMRLFDCNMDFPNGVSCTTCSHIISFCGLHKKDFLKLPYRRYVEFDLMEIYY
jgi:hypothetical protein